MRFSKRPLSFEDQLDRLIERGLVVQDRPRAVHYLAHINYYRLGAYWLPFEADHATHSFHPGTTLEAILDLYVFDRELRLLVMDAIERVEVSIRCCWAYHMAHRHGPHCHLDRRLFKPSWRYDDNFASLEFEVRRSKETFIRHFRQTYNEPLPPIWALVEIMTFGQLSQWYANTRHRGDRNAVACSYDFDESELTSFLHHLTTVRNLCAHHGRLWNREFTFKFKLPRHRPAVLVVSVNQATERRLYNTLTMLLYLMNRVSPEHHWRDRLLRLIEQHGINYHDMGFPTRWRDTLLWSDAGEE